MVLSSGWLMEFLLKLPGMGAPLSKIRRGSNGLDHERSLLEDLIYAKVVETDGKGSEKESQGAKRTSKFCGHTADGLSS